jgi:hypothetical protein
MALAVRDSLQLSSTGCGSARMTKVVAITEASRERQGESIPVCFSDEHPRRPEWKVKPKSRREWLALDETTQGRQATVAVSR